MLNFSKILEHFGHLYGDLPVPILIFDQHRIVCRANNAFCRLIKQDSDQTVGQPINEYFKKLTLFFQQAQFLRLLPEYSQTDLSLTNTEPIPVRLNYCAATDHKDIICGALVCRCYKYLAVFSDIEKTGQVICL